jgi:hypothetical protein
MTNKVHVIPSSSLSEKIIIPSENVNNYRSEFFLKQLYQRDIFI